MRTSTTKWYTLLRKSFRPDGEEGMCIQIQPSIPDVYMSMCLVANTKEFPFPLGENI